MEEHQADKVADKANKTLSWCPMVIKDKTLLKAAGGAKETLQ